MFKRKQRPSFKIKSFLKVGFGLVKKSLIKKRKELVMEKTYILFLLKEEARTSKFK